MSLSLHLPLPMVFHSSIDLRSPKEYKKGTIPNSVNLPILNDAEFHEIGKTLRSNGKKAAIDLGYKLVSGERKVKWAKLGSKEDSCCYDEVKLGNDEPFKFCAGRKQFEKMLQTSTLSLMSDSSVFVIESMVFYTRL